MFHLSNSIRTYHWGSADAISRLLGYGTEHSPQAELWLGAHQGNPSQLRESGQNLDEHIAANPQATLGSSVHERFGQLPYLMKVLAAEQPLSIQVHPSLAQASEGFARENQNGPDLQAATRNYKDNNHKPEMLYALTDFVALSGFRAASSIRADLQALRPALGEVGQGVCDELLQRLTSPADPLRDALGFVLSGAPGIQILVDELAAAIELDQDLAAHRHFSELLWISGFYPSDPGVLVALMMNLLYLQPGQVVSMGAGIIHAYLRGLGIEVMASSDNVLRGGLTSKHIDVPELLKVVHTTAAEPQFLQPEQLATGNELYCPPFEEFQLQVIKHDPQATGVGQPIKREGAGIALCCSGAFNIFDGVNTTSIKRGESVFLPATDQTLTVRGQGPDAGSLYIASSQPAI